MAVKAKEPKSKEKANYAERSERRDVEGLVEYVGFGPGEVPAVDGCSLFELEFIFGKVGGVDLDVSKS